MLGYYAVIPAGVRYDSHVCSNAKLLYGEVTALCNKEGYCWTTNKYFAELYSVSIRTVTNWIRQLTDNGYLKSELIYKEGTKEIVARYLRLPIVAPHPKTPISEEIQPEESPAPIEKTSSIIIQVLIFLLLRIKLKERRKRQRNGRKYVQMNPSATLIQTSAARKQTALFWIYPT